MQNKNKITLITGCMASGKSNFLFNIVRGLELSNGVTYKCYVPENQKNISSRARDYVIKAEKIHKAEDFLKDKVDYKILDEYMFLPVATLKKMIEEEKDADIIIAGLQKDLFNNEWKQYKYLKTIERLHIIELKTQCEFCKKADADFSCCEKLGVNMSLLKDDGAVYKNTCVKCANERGII